MPKLRNRTSLFALAAALFAVLAVPAVASAEGEKEPAMSAIEVHDTGDVEGFRVNFDIEHPYPSDLVVSLRREREGEQTQTIDLVHRPHDAEPLGATHTIDAFQGLESDATYTLLLEDHGVADTGRLTSWTIAFDRCIGHRCIDQSYSNTDPVDIPDAMTWGEVFSSTSFLGAIVNFVLLVVLIVSLGRKPIRKFLETRRRGVEEGLVEAQRLKKAAEEKYEEYSSRLEKLDEEIDALRAEMVKAGEAERERMVAEAEAKAARLRRETQFVIEQQVKQLQIDLTREAVEAAVAAAEKTLEENTTKADQERLANEYLKRLSDVGGAS
ncbi:MAG: proprotein convertase P-domain-containing protein [Myxococcota bacterium]